MNISIHKLTAQANNLIRLGEIAAAATGQLEFEPALEEARQYIGVVQHVDDVASGKTSIKDAILDQLNPVSDLQSDEGLLSFFGRNKY
jgi:hypothetical protein